MYKIILILNNTLYYLIFWRTYLKMKSYSSDTKPFIDRNDSIEEIASFCSMYRSFNPNRYFNLMHRNSFNSNLLNIANNSNVKGRRHG